MGRRKQILIVEDSEFNRDMLRGILSDDYDILEAENGAVALEVLYKNIDTITLILLDVVMPVMDGYEFLSKMKADKNISFVPVIVMTQRDKEKEEIKSLSLGANDFIPKPYKPPVIKHRIANLIKLRESAMMINQFKYDRLTGLYSKEYFYRKVKERLDDNPNKEYTIICCNIVNFKLINDTYGRDEGDRLLIEAADILQKRVSPDSICCRYTADRFLALTEKESEKKGRQCFIEARKKTRSELSKNIPIKLGIYEIKNHNIPVEHMCDRALWVVDTIKGIYDKYVAVYDDKLRNQLLREQDITEAMENALIEKQFEVYFQPKYNLLNNTIEGAESLVRWNHPSLGFLSPGEFIPLFERNGFIRKLDEFVWERTCERLKEWKDHGYALVPVSVNVSRIDVFQSHLVDTFCKLIEKYGIEPEYLHLEITESAYTENPINIIRTVDELRKKGFIIEMDDFGSGYSSLNMLSQMEIDIMKLDMGFIRNELAKSEEKSILGDVVNMAHRMKLKVVAEGVETQNQRDRLQIIGCDLAQGYYYAKPMKDIEFAAGLQMAI